MPIYEYECSRCRAEFELLVRSDRDIECPECHSTRLERKLSVVASPNGKGLGDPLPSPGNCGRPQCGSFGCQGLG